MAKHDIENAYLPLRMLIGPYDYCQGERRHGDIEQTQRCDRSEIGYEVRLLQEYEYYRKSCEPKGSCWYRIGVGIWESI